MYSHVFLIGIVEYLLSFLLYSLESKCSQILVWISWFFLLKRQLNKPSHSFYWWHQFLNMDQLSFQNGEYTLLKENALLSNMPILTKIFFTWHKVVAHVQYTLLKRVRKTKGKTCFGKWNQCNILLPSVCTSLLVSSASQKIVISCRILKLTPPLCLKM